MDHIQLKLILTSNHLDKCLTIFSLQIRRKFFENIFVYDELLQCQKIHYNVTKLEPERVEDREAERINDRETDKEKDRKSDK